MAECPVSIRERRSQRAEIRVKAWFVIAEVGPELRIQNLWLILGGYVLFSRNIGLTQWIARRRLQRHRIALVT